MPDYKSHDFPYMQPERHDEASTGVVAAALTGPQKREAGRFVAGDTGSAAGAGAVGGSRRKGTTRLSHKIDPGTLTPLSVKRARVLRRAMAGEIANTVGGGECGVVASLLIKFAAQKTAAAEEAFEKGDYDTHRKLSESARMDALYAREHAAKTAEARLKRKTAGELPPGWEWVSVDDEGKEVAK